MQRGVFASWLYVGVRFLIVYSSQNSACSMLCVILIMLNVYVDCLDVRIHNVTVLLLCVNVSVYFC